MKNNKIHWWRPSLLVLVCGVVSFGIAQVYCAMVPAQAPADEIDRLVAELSDLKTPRADLAPDEVVRIQMAGLSDSNVARGILQCMAFASPANRRVTGPLERFAAMVQNPPYSALIHPDSFVIGNPTIVDDQARVVTTVVRGDSVHAFVWILNKQIVPPYRDCWMTGIVEPVGQADWSGKDQRQNPDVI